MNNNLRILAGTVVGVILLTIPLFLLSSGGVLTVSWIFSLGALFTLAGTLFWGNRRSGGEYVVTAAFPLAAAKYFTVELLFFADDIGTAIGTHGTETTAVLLRQDIAGRDECRINEISTVVKGVCRNKGCLGSIDPGNIIITEFADDKAIAAKGGNAVGQNIGIQRT